MAQNPVVTFIMEDGGKKFLRLGPGKEVRLKNAYIIACSDEKDEQGHYLIYDQDQFYGVKAVLISPLCGFPAKPADFKRVMQNLGLDNLRVPYVYDSIRKIHPHQLPQNVELWHQYQNIADEYSLKQVRPAVRLMELIEEENR